MANHSKDRGKLADPKLLEVIDKLFEYNIGEYVALPQLLVVGDQSSGKSSVLEGLTKLPFPRDSGLCTRFATQITFRRAPTTKIAVSIIPSANATKEVAEKLRAWKKEGIKKLEREVFASILNEVHELMGVGKPSEPGKRTFSDDVLRIEICDPDQEHLSVIDVPGIFRRVTEGVTTQSDKAMVRDMVTSYMQNPRSIILAVIPANVDIATQEILDMAEELDKKGQRTLGVLTKPDLVDKSSESNVIDLLQGRSHKLNLGWAIVRNPGQEELANASFDRNFAELNFFKTRNPWAKLGKDKVGIESLQTRLGEILAETVRREFPHVKADINKKLKDCKYQLDSLGPSRETKDQQHKFLLELATQFQNLTSLALKAHYGGSPIFENSQSLKLATLIVSRNELFSRDVAMRGHVMTFGKEAEAKDSEGEEASAPENEKMDSTQMDLLNLDDASRILSNPQPRTANRYTTEHEDLDELLYHPAKVVEPKSSGIMEWLEGIYKSSRGFELGTYDCSIVPIIWKKQSAHWDDLALSYISDVICIVHRFHSDLIRSCCRDERVVAGINSVLSDHLIKRYSRAIDHVKFVLYTERNGTPITANHYFANNLEKCRQLRVQKGMKNKAVWSPQQSAQLVSLDVVMQTYHASNLDHIVQDLHDILQSYYKVARKRFVDNCCMQGADYHLVTGPDAPVRVFSPAFVADLSSEQLETIAGEDVATRRKRAALKYEIENLEKGKKALV
ncbi:MAG: hypothetical protein Q9191_006890 [Dirinaria sp. TL-2023a]